MAGTKKLARYAVTGELITFGSADYQHPVGPLVHELGHAMFGLPDLYDRVFTHTSGSYGNRGLGRFSTMSNGCWGRYFYEQISGEMPIGLDAWSRQYLGWATPRIVTTPQTVIFDAALTSPSAPVKIPILGSSEYFLIECRSQQSWDMSLFGAMYGYRSQEWISPQYGGWYSGLTILHVDERVGTPIGYDINDTYERWDNPVNPRPYQGVILEEATTVDGSLTNRSLGLTLGAPSHLFGLNTNDRFDDATTPNARTHDSLSSLFGIYDIRTASTSPISYYHQQALVVPSGTIATPEFSPDGGAYVTGSNVSVTISCKTPGVTIRYTKNGADPTSSSTLYTSPVTLNATTTLKARAFKSGCTNSAVKSATYTFSRMPSVVSISPSSGTINNSTWVTYTCVYSDPDGWQDLGHAMFRISDPVGGITNCAYFDYSQNYNRLYMFQNGPGWIPTNGIVLGTDYIIETEDAYLDCKNTTVSGSGNNLTVNWRIMLKPHTAGVTGDLMLRAYDDAGLYTNWIDKGNVTIR